MIPDWGGRDETFEVALLEPGAALVHRSVRGRMRLSWAIVFTARGPGETRIYLRLRLGPVAPGMAGRNRRRSIRPADIAGLAAGLRERVR